MLDYKTKLSAINNIAAAEQNITIDMLRLDKIHRDISGNKWFKLKYNIEKAQKENKKTIITFGGAFSNHIVATAAACNMVGLKSVGIIRGEKHKELNPTLKKAHGFGMDLYYVSRKDYKEKPIPFAIKDSDYVVPEGGANLLGVKGCEEIITDKLANYNIVCCSAGTGATAAGILKSLKSYQKLYVFPALKNGDFLKKIILDFTLQKNINNLSFITNYSFNGYGKVSPELINFVLNFKSQQNIQLDYIYNGKMVYGVFDLIKKKEIAPNSKVLIIHCGGTQGNVGIEERYKKYFTSKCYKNI